MKRKLLGLIIMSLFASQATAALMLRDIIFYNRTARDIVIALPGSYYSTLATGLTVKAGKGRRWRMDATINTLLMAFQDEVVKFEGYKKKYQDASRAHKDAKVAWEKDDAKWRQEEKTYLAEKQALNDWLTLSTQKQMLEGIELGPQPKVTPLRARPIEPIFAEVPPYVIAYGRQYRGRGDKDLRFLPLKPSDVIDPIKVDIGFMPGSQTEVGARQTWPRATPKWQLIMALRNPYPWQPMKRADVNPEERYRDADLKFYSQ